MLNREATLLPGRLDAISDSLLLPVSCRGHVLCVGSHAWAMLMLKDSS